MTLEEIIRTLRRDFLDDMGGTAVSWEDINQDDAAATQLRWTNEELTQHINRAISKAHRSAKLISDHDATFAIPIVAGTSEYVFDPRIIEILGVRGQSDGAPLAKTETDEVWPYNRWDTTTGKPRNWIPDYKTDTIHLYPQPVADDTLDLWYYREELAQLSWSDPSTSPEIKDKQLFPALYYALHLAYLKDEANALDPQKSQEYLALFERDYPRPASVYSDQRKLRSRNRSANYGGLPQDRRTLGRTGNPYGSRCDDPYYP